MNPPNSLSDLWLYKVQTKAELLTLIDRYWTALNAFVDSLTPAQLTDVKNPDGWALKDHLTHLTAWQQSVIRFLNGEPRHLGLGIPEAMFIYESYDAMNDAIFRAHQHEPLDIVIDHLRAAHDELLARVQQLTDNDLQQPYGYYLNQPGKPDARRAIDVIYENTAPHFREHQEWMQQTLEQTLETETAQPQPDSITMDEVRTMPDQYVTTKAELLDHIARDWTAINDFVNSLTPAQIIQIKNPDGWTIKDHLAHLTAWEQSVIAFLKGEPRHEGLGVPEAVYLKGSEDEINDIIYRKRRYEPLDTVLDNWQVAHEQVMALVNALDDDDLQKRYSHYLPDEPGEGDGPPAMNVIYGNTADHFRMHQGWMEAMVARADTVE